MTPAVPRLLPLSLVLGLALTLGLGGARAQTPSRDAVRAAVQTQQGPLIQTLESLVNIESGSTNVEGLARIRDLIASRLQALGMQVDLLAPTPEATASRSFGSMVRGRLTGSGKAKIALIAHMDTVYPQGMLVRQPFRVDGDRIFGLGISDDKSGIAAILHTVAVLQQLKFQDYGELTVLINADEEIGSPGSRSTITALGRDSDVVLSFEGSAVNRDYVRLATSAIATATLKVTGRASHAGANPEAGRNAFYELAHQVLQTRDFSKPREGLKLNWTVASAGAVRNVIPEAATAEGDVRALRTADFDALEQRLRETIKNQLIPDTKVELQFVRGRPPLTPTDKGREVAALAADIAKEIGRKLDVVDQALGGGTDAAYASLQAKGAVVESFGLQGHGGHSADDEYVLRSSIEPRLYITTRLIQELATRR